MNRVEYDSKPAEYDVLQTGYDATVRVRENIEQIGDGRWEADEYQLLVPWVPNIKLRVGANFPDWLMRAKIEDAPKADTPAPEAQWKADVENALVELADMIAGGV